MQNLKYRDPENLIIIKDKIKNAPTMGDLKKILDEVYPSWFQGILPDYSPDYPELKKNWLDVCKKNNTTPKEIMMVDFISFEKEYSLINIFSEILTLSGFCVRSKQEIFPCKICNKAIPQLHIYNLLKKTHTNLPEYWRTTCENCS